MKKLLLLVSILFIANSLVSCKKENDKPSKEELLTDHKWRGVDAVIYSNGTEVNRMSLNSSLLFKKNHDYIVYDENGDETGRGTWKLVEGSPDVLKLTSTSSLNSVYPKVLNLDQSNRSVTSTDDFFIEKLTETKLSIYIEEDVNGDTMKYVLNYKK